MGPIAWLLLGQVGGVPTSDATMLYYYFSATAQIGAFLFAAAAALAVYRLQQMATHRRDLAQEIAEDLREELPSLASMVAVGNWERVTYWLEKAEGVDLAALDRGDGDDAAPLDPQARKRTLGYCLFGALSLEMSLVGIELGAALYLSLWTVGWSLLGLSVSSALASSETGSVVWMIGTGALCLAEVVLLYYMIRRVADHSVAKHFLLRIEAIARRRASGRSVVSGKGRIVGMLREARASFLSRSAWRGHRGGRPRS